MGAATAKVEADPLFPERPASLFTDNKTAYGPKQLQKRAKVTRRFLSERIPLKELVSIVLDYAATIRHVWQASPTYKPEPISIISSFVHSTDPTGVCSSSIMRCTDPAGASRSFRIISTYSVKALRRWRIQIEFQPYRPGWVAVGVTSVRPNASMRSYFDRSSATTEALLVPARHPPRPYILHMTANIPFSEAFRDTPHLLLEKTKSMAILEMDESNHNLCIDCAESGGPICRTILPITIGAEVELWPCVIGGQTVAATILPCP